MTLTRQVYLLCEGDGCLAMTGTDTFAHDAKDARQQAKRLGWRRINGRDLCRVCVYKSAKERSGA